MVVVVHGPRLRLLDQQVLAERHLKGVMPTDTAQMGMPKRLVAVVVRAVRVLLRQVQSVVMAELEFQVR